MSYGGKGGGGLGDGGGDGERDTESKYERLYEADLDPFKEFDSRECGWLVGLLVSCVFVLFLHLPLLRRRHTQHSVEFPTPSRDTTAGGSGRSPDAKFRQLCFISCPVVGVAPFRRASSAGGCCSSGGGHG